MLQAFRGPTRLAVVRLQTSMLQSSTHALVQRLLFTPARKGVHCFWSYTHTDDEVSLIIDEESLSRFPEEALIGSSSRWRPLRLCGKSFAFDETGVVSAMFAPYEDGMALLNFSTFSTNVTANAVAGTALCHAARRPGRRSLLTWHCLASFTHTRAARRCLVARSAGLARR